MIEKKITDAAEVLARKQLGIEPKKDGVQDEKDLPEMLVQYTKTFENELTEKFKLICASMEQRFGLRDLSEDTMLAIANKIHEEAQNGNLNSIATIAENGEIVNIAEKAAIKQQRVETINKIIDGDISPERKEISGMILGAAIAATIDKEYEGLDLSNNEEVNRVHGLEHALNATKNIGRHVDETGKIKPDFELGLIAGVGRTVGLGKNISLEEAKAFAIEEFGKLNPEKYHDFIERCRGAKSKDELDELLTREFYDRRAERNGRQTESYEDFRKKFYRVRELSDKEREEVRRRTELSPKERREEDRLKRESDARRSELSEKFKSIREKINDGTVDYSEVSDFVGELRTSEFQAFYHGVLNNFTKYAKEKGDTSLEDVCKKFEAKDKEDAEFEAKKAEPEIPVVGSEDDFVR